MSRRTEMCQIDDCPKKRQKKTIFCKKHERHIPKKMMTEVRKFFREHQDGYKVTDFDMLVKKANFSITVDDYEKRFKHYRKTRIRKLMTKKIYVIEGSKEDQSEVINNEAWLDFWKVVDSLELRKSIVLTQGELNSDTIKDPCAVILLGEAGVKATMPPGRAKNGIYITTIDRQAATPEKCFESAWKERPTSPRDSCNYYYQAPTISCEPHPDEYEEFGEGELRQLEKCLEWAKQFLYKEGK